MSLSTSLQLMKLKLHTPHELARRIARPLTYEAGYSVLQLTIYIECTVT